MLLPGPSWPGSRHLPCHRRDVEQRVVALLTICRQARDLHRAITEVAGPGVAAVQVPVEQMRRLDGVHDALYALFVALRAVDVALIPPRRAVREGVHDA